MSNDFAELEKLLGIPAQKGEAILGLCKQLENMYKFSAMQNKDVYIYDKALGYSIFEGERTIETELQKYCPRISGDAVHAIIEKIRMRNPADRKKFDADATWLHVDNGWLNRNTKEFEGHSPDRPSLAKIPHVYDAGATNPEQQKFFEDVFEEGDLAGEKAQKLVEEKYAQLSKVGKVDRIFVIDAGGTVVLAAAPQGAPDFIGRQPSSEWVQQVREAGAPVFSNGYVGLDGEYRMVISVPVVNRDTGEYLGIIALSAITTSFFQFYGNLENIDSQFLVVYDEKGDIIASPVKDLLGKNAFGAELRQFTRNSTVVEENHRLLFSGQKVVSVYDYGLGERLNMAGPIFVNEKAEYFIQLITPTATIYSNTDAALAETRARTFLLLATATAAVAVVALYIVRRSATLEKDVESRTKELQESNEQLAARTDELARANEELKARDTLQQEVVNIAAHELRTPVLPIVLSAESLAESMPENEEVRIILRNATRMTKLTNDILDVSRIESRSLKIKKEELSIDDLLAPLVRDYGAALAEKGVELSYAPSGMRVAADRSRLTQVFTNLLDNASYFTSQGRIAIAIHENACEVAVAISDTGRGIDPELMPKLFTKFATKSEKGTGLGLYICKAIVEAHGGRMWAENNPGSGATFHFTLPA